MASINKRPWTAEEYAEWFASLETKPTPNTTRQDRYEIKQTSGLNYLVTGNGARFWVDGIADKTVLEAKLIVNAPYSPYLAGSKAADFVREKAVYDVRNEVRRVAAILRDENNPLRAMRIITNDARAIPLFASLLTEYEVPGEVVVVAEER